jgi:hypothetical protein
LASVIAGGGNCESIKNKPTEVIKIKYSTNKKNFYCKCSKGDCINCICSMNNEKCNEKCHKENHLNENCKNQRFKYLIVE